MLNFSAGPSQLPLSVIKKLQEDFKNYKQASVMELSHRGEYFFSIYEQAIKDAKELYNLNDDYEVLFLQGGASLNFALIPLNFAYKRALYANTGLWSEKAIKEARIINKNAVEVVACSKDQGYSYIPQFSFDEDGDYAYICSNNTIYGTQFKSLPKGSDKLVIDASSDLFSKPLDFSDIAMLFGGTQKNAGIAGLGLVIIRKDFLKNCKRALPSMLSYETYSKNDSMFNTPASFAIYVFSLVMKELKARGGLENIHELNKQKARLIYELIDSSDGFYKGYANKKDRSLMNISFSLKNEALNQSFLKAASEQGFIGLKGHKILGGIRASIYNALSLEEVSSLAALMKDFLAKKG